MDMTDIYGGPSYRLHYCTHLVGAHFARRKGSRGVFQARFRVLITLLKTTLKDFRDYTLIIKIHK